MLEWNETKLDVTAIEFEPGDYTRYSFFVHRFGDDFLIMQNMTAFPIPNRLNKWKIIEVIKGNNERELKNHRDIEAIAQYFGYPHKSGMNPHTVCQIARAIYRIFLEGKE